MFRFDTQGGFMKTVLFLMLVVSALNVYAAETSTDCPFTRDSDERQAEGQGSDDVKVQADSSSVKAE